MSADGTREVAAGRARASCYDRCVPDSDKRRTYRRGARIVVPIFVVVTVIMVGFFAWRMHELRRENDEIMAHVFDDDAMTGMVVAYCTDAGPDDPICNPQNDESDAGRPTSPP